MRGVQPIDVLFVKNVSREGPGRLQDFLQDTPCSFEVVDLDAGDEVPDLTKYKAVILLGGPDSANDSSPKILQELMQIKAGLAAGVPMLGICLGLQLLVKAAGGAVVPSPMKEVGFTDPEGQPFTIDLTDEGKQAPLLQGLPSYVDVFHLHGETVEPTPEMHTLGTGKYCRNQIVQLNDKTFGMQSHFELTPPMLRDWCEQDPDLVDRDVDELVRHLEAIQPDYWHTADTILGNFLAIAGLRLK